MATLAGLGTKDQNAEARAIGNAAKIDAADARQSKVDAEGSAGRSEDAAEYAEAQSNRAVAAAEASGDFTPFNTKALADAGAAGLDDGEIVAVWTDESRGGAYSKYTVQGGVLTNGVTITRPVATEADAVAGVRDDVDMTPSTTQAVIGEISTRGFANRAALVGNGDVFPIDFTASTRSDGLLYRRVATNGELTDAAGQLWRGVVDLAAPQSVVKSGVSLAGGDQRAAIQAALNQASLADRAGAREVVIRGSGSFLLSNHIALPSKVSLIFDKSDLALLPTAADTTLIRAWGAKPTQTYALPADVGRGAGRIPLGANSGLVTAGTYIQVRSNARIDTSPNSNNMVKAQYFKVIYMDGSVAVLDRAVYYDYLVADGATWGIMNMMSDVRISGGVFGQEGGPNYARAIDLRYVDGVIIDGWRGGYNRGTWDNTDAFGRTNANMIGIRGCHDVSLTDVKGEQGAWYLVEVSGASQDVTVRDVIGDTYRHTVSVNWVDEGEPVNVLSDNITGYRNTRAVWDAHDVGSDLTARAVRAYGSLFDGIQTRTSNTLIEDAVAVDCGGNGILVYVTPGASAASLKNVTLKNVRSERNGGSGIKSLVPVTIEGFCVRDNGKSFAGGTSPDRFFSAGGIMATGGVWSVGVAENNFPNAFGNNLGGAEDKFFAPVTVENFSAPASALQDTLFIGPTGGFNDQQSALLKDGRSVGYASGKIAQRGSGSNTSISNFFRTRNMKFSAEDMDGTAILAGGVATIPNANIVGESFSVDNRWKSRVLVQRISKEASTSIGNLQSVLSNGQLVVTALDSAGATLAGDASRIQYEIL